MDKKITTIYIRKDVLEFCKANKVNLSQWINVEFFDKFLSIKAKQAELEAIGQRREKVMNEVKEIKKRLSELSESLTDREKRYISTVIPNLKKGSATWEGALAYFNNEFKRNSTLEDFKSVVDLYETQARTRLDYALSKLAQKKKNGLYKKH